jgi:predicted alpha/beta superfamily hydrolase
MFIKADASLEPSGALIKSFSVYGNKDGGVPLFVLNTYEGDGSSEWTELQKLGATSLTLVVVHGIAWDADMSPYPVPPVFKGNAFLGKGEEHLDYLLKKVLPSVVKTLSNPPSFYGIAGYSLAGLFACSTLFWDSPFTRVASASGSLWYPGFVEFAEQSGQSLNHKSIALSLGDKESQNRNPVLATVGAKTEQFAKICQDKGAQVTFEWNEGNHYANPDWRMAKAIAKLLG